MEQIEADVCIVGAGYAGLTAARRLVQAGRQWWCSRRATASAAACGPGRARAAPRSTWAAPSSDRTRTERSALAAEMGVELYPTNVAGDSLLATGGRLRRYEADKTPRINPVALASFGQAMLRLDRMAKTVPVDAPVGRARRPPEWDATTAAAWLSRANVPTAEGRDMLEATLRALFASHLSEVSLLNVLFLIKSGGGLLRFMSIEGGYQHFQVHGGAQSIAQRVADELGDADPPRRTCPHGAPPRRRRRRCAATAIEVAARRVVMAIPPALAGARPLRPAAARRQGAAAPPDAGRHRDQGGGGLRRAVLAAGRPLRRVRGHRRRLRGHPRHVARRRRRRRDGAVRRRPQGAGARAADRGRTPLDRASTCSSRRFGPPGAATRCR